MSQRRLRLRIGIFVASTFVLLGVLIYLFGSFPDFFRSRAGKLYIVEFEDAPGLEVGVPVRRSGVRIGRVEKRELDDETGKVRAWIRIESKYTIRKHEKPTLTTALVSGDVAIDFLPSEDRDPPPDRSPVPAGTVLQGEKPASVTSLVTRAQQVVSPAQEVLVRISKSLDRLEKISPDLQKALKEYTELGIEVRRLLPDAQKVMRSADRTFTDLNTKYLPELDKTNQEARRLVTSLNTLATNVNAIVPDVGKLVRTLDSTTADAGKLMRDVNTLVPDVQRLLRVTGSAINDAQKLIPEAQKLFREGNTLVADLTKTSASYRKLAESADRAIPQLLETNKQAQGLMKNIDSLVPEARTAIKATTDAVTSARLAADEYKKLGESLNVLLQTNQDSIQNSVKYLEELLRDARKVVNDDNARRINGLLKDLEEAAFRLPSMARNADVILRRVRDSLEKLAGPSGVGGQEARGLLQNLNEAAVKLNRTMGDIQEIVKAAARNDGTLQRLLSDKSLYNNLDDSALMLTRVLPRLDRILKDLEVFADKIARHPESLGIGGAIRPSSGLKESPNRLYPPPVQGPVIRQRP